MQLALRISSTSIPLSRCVPRYNVFGMIADFLLDSDWSKFLPGPSFWICFELKLLCVSLIMWLCGTPLPPQIGRLYFRSVNGVYKVSFRVSDCLFVNNRVDPARWPASAVGHSWVSLTLFKLQGNDDNCSQLADFVSYVVIHLIYSNQLL